jgi:DNA-binding HxlR family transcriptional regulator
MRAHKKEPSGNGARRARKILPGISQRVHLRELIADQMARREPKGAAPAPIEYSLTECGESSHIERANR